MARGAPLVALDDETPLNGREPDVAVRIGWTARMCRLGAPGQPTLDAMSRLLAASTATLHRLETGRLRDGALLDAYERALARPTGSLRAPVDVACRTFPAAPQDRNPASPVTTVRELSALTERVASGEAVGGEWLAWARGLSRPGAIGMPESLARSLVEQLVGELSRSVGHAHPSRYEALALLRGSEYGSVVVDAARAWVADPDVQVLYDLCSAVGEAVTPEGAAWCVDLLDDPRDRVLIGGVLALENMAQVAATPSFWRELVDPIARRFNASEPGSARWSWLSHLLRLMPRRLTSAGSVGLRHQLATPARIGNWSRTRLNTHWSECQDRAHMVTEALGMPDQPLLARLLFDVAISPYETSAVTSNLLLGALPRLSVPLAAHVADLAEHHEDPVVRDRAGRRLPGALHGHYLPLVDVWLAGSDTELRDRGLYVAGAAGVRVDHAVLRAAITDGGPSLRAAMYAAGMAAHPRLGSLTTDRRAGAPARGAARWWTRTGARVLD